MTMKRFNKKLYYKYFDLMRISSFLGDSVQEKRATATMNVLLANPEADFERATLSTFGNLGLSVVTINEIQEYQITRQINYIENYLSQVPEWLRMLILTDFFDTTQLAQICREEKIKTKDILLSYFRGNKAKVLFGKEKALLNAHYVETFDNPNFPLAFAHSYDDSSKLRKSISGVPILGCFHNHTQYSDGQLTLRELHKIATLHGRLYVGVSDHSKTVTGMSEQEVLRQHAEIDELNAQGGCYILKSIECEIMSNGMLELNNNCLKMMDYVIAAVHHNINITKREAEQRVVRAIEHPLTSMLAHPSARMYKKKAELFVDMYKIIDACVSNGVAIEINGDPARLDLDPRYIDYALSRGAVFALNSDTHNSNGFLNINNSIAIAEMYSIPPERILNTFNESQLKNYFNTNKQRHLPKCYL